MVEKKLKVSNAANTTFGSGSEKEILIKVMKEKELHQNKRIDLGHGCFYENGEVK